MSEVPVMNRKNGVDVSIVIDHYEQGDYVKTAIASALAQAGPRCEVVVVDDGSRDGSREVIERYGTAVVPVWKENGGQASALNAGFAASRGEVVLFLDADDALLPDAAERALACFDSPDVVKVHWPMNVIDESGAPTGETIPGGVLPEGDRRDALIEAGPTTEIAPPTSGNAWSRRFLERVLPIPEDVYRTSADKHLLEVAPFCGELRRVDEPLSLYRRHGAGSQVSRSVEERLANELRYYACYVEVIEKRLAEEGIRADRDRWVLNSWWHRQAAALEDLAALPHAESPLVLVEEAAWGAGTVAGRTVLPFLERDGAFWGSPPDDATAIAELERMRNAGAAGIAFVWSTFWWLDHYRGFREHLESRYARTCASDRVLAFDLTRGPEGSRG